MILLALLTASVAVALLGAVAWKLTGSKPILANVVFATMAFLVAAQSVYRHGPNDWSAVIAFFSTMIIGGRALGTWLRSRRQQELAPVARLLMGASVIALAATAIATWPLWN